MKKVVIFLLLVTFPVMADPFLAAHIILNSLAAKYLPDYESTTYHGFYIGGTYGYRWELGEAYKTGGDTEGSTENSPGFSAGYQFLRSPSHKFALTFDRKWANYQTKDEVENKDVIDSWGMRVNFGILAFKLGWSSHAFENSSNKHDGGAFTGFGIDFYFKKISIYFDITDHYLEDRGEHIAGGDIGLRYSFGDSEG